MHYQRGFKIEEKGGTLTAVFSVKRGRHGPFEKRELNPAQVLKELEKESVNGHTPTTLQEAHFEMQRRLSARQTKLKS